MPAEEIEHICSNRSLHSDSPLLAAHKVHAGEEKHPPQWESAYSATVCRATASCILSGFLYKCSILRGSHCNGDNAIDAKMRHPVMDLTSQEHRKVDSKINSIHSRVRRSSFTTF